jgi:hypothetical protein
VVRIVTITRLRVNHVKEVRAMAQAVSIRPYPVFDPIFVNLGFVVNKISLG